MQFARLNDIDVSGKTVLIREDLNVPLKDGKIAIIWAMLLANLSN